MLRSAIAGTEPAMTIWAELAIILVLTIMNGPFAGAEIAILSVRKTRLRELASEGSRAAQALESTRELPERFLATVQIGNCSAGRASVAAAGRALGCDRIDSRY